MGIGSYHQWDKIICLLDFQTTTYTLYSRITNEWCIAVVIFIENTKIFHKNPLSFQYYDHCCRYWELYQYSTLKWTPKGNKKSLKIPKGQSEFVNRKMTDNIMAKRKRTKGQSTIHFACLSKRNTECFYVFKIRWQGII